MLQPEHEGAASDRSPYLVGVGGELSADRGADEVGAVGIEALLHQQIDLPEVDHPKVDRQLFGRTDSGSYFCAGKFGHPCTIHLDSIWMVLDHRNGTSASEAPFEQPRVPDLRRRRREGLGRSAPSQI